MICAFIVVADFAFAFTETDPGFTKDPPTTLLAGLIGACSSLFIAYAIVAVSLIRGLRARNRNLEYLLGSLVGLALCGALGIGIALALTEAPEPLPWIDRFGLCWSGLTVFFFAFSIAISPMVAYEEARSRHLDPDE